MSKLYELLSLQLLAAGMVLVALFSTFVAMGVSIPGSAAVIGGGALLMAVGGWIASRPVADERNVDPPPAIYDGIQTLI